MKLSTGVNRRPKPMIVSQTKTLEPLQTLEPEDVVQDTPQPDEPKEDQVTLSKAELDPISEAAVENLPDAVPQEAVKAAETAPAAQEQASSDAAQAADDPKPRSFKPKPFHIVLGAGALALLGTLMFRGGGVTNGRSNLDSGNGGPIPQGSPDIPTFNGRKLNIK